MGLFSIFSRQRDAQTAEQQQAQMCIRDSTYHDLLYTEGYLPDVARSMTIDKLSRSILGKDGIYNIFDKAPEQLFDQNGKIVSDAKTKYSADWMKEAQAVAPIRQEYQL